MKSNGYDILCIHLCTFKILFLSHPCTPPHPSQPQTRLLQEHCLFSRRCRLDYANSTLLGISVKNISRLQRSQSTLARVVTCQRGRISIFKTLQELHWLPIKWCIDYKVATLMYKLLESGEPTYMRSRITSRISRRALRSSADNRQLEPCSSHAKIGSRAFRCAAPAIWNCLPYDIRAVPSVSIFRRRSQNALFQACLLKSYFGFKRS